MEPDQRPPLSVRILAPLLRLFFRLLYHRFAWTYDFVAAAVSVGLWKQWVKAVVPYVQGPRLLELGHGPGHLQIAISEHLGGQGLICGLDRSPQMGRQAVRRIRRAGLAPALVSGQAQALPYPAQTFQCVVATFPTEYIIHPETLLEIRRVLAPGGRLVVLPVAWITGRNPLHRSAAWLFHITGQSTEVDQRALDPVRAAGFEVQTEWIHLPSSRLLIVQAVKG